MLQGPAGSLPHRDYISSWLEWMRPTLVDGAILKFPGEHHFEDSAHAYRDEEDGRDLLAHKRHP